MRRQDGQIIPALAMVMLALLAVGMLFLQVGRAAVLSTEAQTAADAAALAAAKNVQDQLMHQVATLGTSDLALVDSGLVRAAADRYASRNDAHVTRIDRQGVDVKVWVASNETLGDGGKRVNAGDSRAEARARARVELFVLPGSSESGETTGSGRPNVTPIADDEWEKLGKGISSPPKCGATAAANDIVALGELLRAHGFLVGENADLGDDPAPGVHSATGFHYQCHHSAAIDVNVGQGDEGAAIDELIEPLHKLGYRTIWRATGHYDHIHIDVANGSVDQDASIGSGSGSGGAVGGLEETSLAVKLIDWDAAYATYIGGFGGAGGPITVGPPDPAVARTICTVLDRYNAPAKVRLAAFETAIVESGVHNLPYGDRDSLGVYQQRPSQGWGTPAQIMNVDYAATQFITRAIRANGNQTAGQLSQDVQISAFPDRYDQVALQAAAMLNQYCGG